MKTRTLAVVLMCVSLSWVFAGTNNQFGKSSIKGAINEQQFTIPEVIVWNKTCPILPYSIDLTLPGSGGITETIYSRGLPKTFENPGVILDSPVEFYFAWAMSPPYAFFDDPFFKPKKRRLQVYFVYEPESKEWKIDSKNSVFLINSPLHIDIDHGLHITGYGTLKEGVNVKDPEHPPLPETVYLTIFGTPTQDSDNRSL